MYFRFFKPVSLALAVLALSITSLAQDETPVKKQRHELTPKEIKELSKKGTWPPKGKTFVITTTQAPNQFSLLLSDEQGRTVINVITLKQVLIYEAVLDEARKFAQTNEAAGTDKAVTTRFMDPSEPGLIVDVMKKGLESQFFITIQGSVGKLTLEGGSIKRGEQGEPKGVFFDMIRKIEAVKTAPLSQ